MTLVKKAVQRTAWVTDNCTMWLNRGWLHHEGPLRREADHQATVTLTSEGDRCRAELVYQGEDGDSVVTVATELTIDERQSLAAALEYTAEKADEYVPRTTTNSHETEHTLRLRMKSFATMAIPTGITLAIAYGVMAQIGSRTGEDFTVNGEPVSFAPDPVAFLGVTALVLFMFWSIQYLPGYVGGVHR